MQAEDVLFWTRARPFKPFRITMNSGRCYDVRHPELVRIVDESLIVFTPRGDEPDGPAKAEMIGLNLFERIEAIVSSDAVNSKAT
jgi:hypothetical protein